MYCMWTRPGPAGGPGEEEDGSMNEGRTASYSQNWSHNELQGQRRVGAVANSVVETPS